MLNEELETARSIDGVDGTAPHHGRTSANLLRERREELVGRWERSVREESRGRRRREQSKRCATGLRALIDELALVLDRLDAFSPGSATYPVDHGSTWRIDERIADHEALGAALRAFSHFRCALMDLFFAEGVLPTPAECRLISATIDDSVTAMATQMRDAEQRRLLALRDLFIAILGHDLRNPLNAITIASSALLRHGLPEGDAS